MIKYINLFFFILSCSNVPEMVPDMVDLQKFDNLISAIWKTPKHVMDLFIFAGRRNADELVEQSFIGIKFGLLIEIYSYQLKH